jgi:Recombination, repair and ssDNA binding protein UvsY
MTLDEILNDYNIDSKINQLDLDNEGVRIPLLHHKYLRLLSIENRELRKYESQYKKLVQLKTEYFGGFLNGTDELKKLGWDPFTRTVVKADIPRFVEADQSIINLTEIIGEQKEKVSVLSSILKEIMARNYVITNILNWIKFNAGV